MPKASIIYGSSTGNTAFAAEKIQEMLQQCGYSCTLSNVTDVSADILKEPFDLYLLGCSTWGEDEIEFQEDFELFYRDLSGDLSLHGKRFAVFGCGDTVYPNFCGAVDAIEDRLDQLGASLVYESLRIDKDPKTQEIDEWIKEVINA